MIAIIDYGAGNLRSVANAVRLLGYTPEITGNPQQIQNARVVIFPGVGAARDTMHNLSRTGLDKTIIHLAEQNRPMLAICVGMQVLFTSSEEDGGLECLDIIPGTVRRFREGFKTPHMGWNQVYSTSPYRFFKGITDGSDFYFVHSYYAMPRDTSVIVGKTWYGVDFPSIIARGNLVATQFHPEKSGPAGLKLYRNFLQLALESAG